MSKTLKLVPVLLLLAPACVGSMGAPEPYDCLFNPEDCVIDRVTQELIDGGELPAEASSEDVVEQLREGGCFVTGIGHIGDELDHPGAGRADEDSFGGNAMGMRDGRVRGQWQNTTHLGDKFHGQAEWLRCWDDGGLGPEVPHAEVNVAQWGGPGKWNHESGYTFMVYAEDRAEGGSHMDYYMILVWDSAGELVYSESETIDGGNFQIHPPNGGHPYEPSAPPEADEWMP